MKFEIWSTFRFDGGGELRIRPLFTFGKLRLGIIQKNDQFIKDSKKNSRVIFTSSDKIFLAAVRYSTYRTLFFEINKVLYDEDGGTDNDNS